MSEGPARQLPLPLAGGAAPDPADLLEDASNAEALAWLRRPGDWPAGRLALWGPPAAGKTLLLRWAAARHGWPLLAGPALSGLPELPAGAAGLALDDADQVPEERALLHLINLCAEAGMRLLLAAREPPARWPAVRLPDLASRLRGTATVGIEPPGDALLAALLAKHFADRQLRVDPGVQAWLLARLPREAAAVAAAAARLDAAALASGGRVGRALARRALAGLPGFAGAEEEPPGEEPPGDAAAAEPGGSGDISMADAKLGSRAGSGVL